MEFVNLQCGICGQTTNSLAHANCVGKQESELERLVLDANKGFEAQDRIRELFPNKIEMIGFDFQNWFMVSDWGRKLGYRYRIKPKPAFEPFYVGPTEHSLDGRSGAWLVNLDGDTLHVGCKTFPASLVMQSLKSISGSGMWLNTSLEGAVPRGNKFGVVWSEYALSWGDCDRILEALTKEGIK